MAGKYTIKEGDTLLGLDRRFGFLSGSFQRANPNIIPKRLQIGSDINYPGTTKYVREPYVPSIKPVSRRTVQEHKYLSPFIRGVAYAETGSLKDPWIRTKVKPRGGSTAYGPLQVTGSKVRDFLNRYKTQMAPHKEFINKVMNPMYSKFVQYGGEPNKPGYDKRWDYGGSGITATPEIKKNYINMVKTMMDIDKAEALKKNPSLSGDDLNRELIRRWRGVPYQKDPRYYNKVLSVLNGSK